MSKVQGPVSKTGLRGGFCGNESIADEAVSETVPPEVAVPPEHLATGVAVVGLDVGVRQEVRFEVAALVEGATARVTLVRGVLHVEDAVHCQCPGLTKTFTALRALERLLLGVDVPEIREVSFKIHSFIVQKYETK
ncbi:hypothetical protein TNCV_2654091 [Trichonephila clavipes]|nr:hypothetical protein TNCV_2654091 [Trichonephila clavipes]